MPTSVYGTTSPTIAAYVSGHRGKSLSAATLRGVRRIATVLLLAPLLGVPLDLAAGQVEHPEFIFSPWTRFCPTGRDANSKHVCFTIKLGHFESSQSIAAAILAESQDNRNKVLRVLLPFGMQLPQGARVVVDGGQPLNAPYIDCSSKGCAADYEVADELIGKLKTGQTLAIQGINSRGKQTSIDLPLAGFASANSEPPSTDAKRFRELEEVLPRPDGQAPGEFPVRISSSEKLIYSPWTKFCLKGEGHPEPACFTGKDGRVGLGPIMVAAVLIEPVSGAKRVFRVTIPLGMQMRQGTRVIVDDGEPMTAPYIVCFSNGCMADYEASDELIGRLKSGKRLAIQGINSQGQPVSRVLPLADFGKAYNNPPTDPKVFEQQQKELQEQLNKGAEDKRKKRS